VLTATTAGALTLFGGLLGTAGAYLTLAAGHLELDAFTPVPLLQLVIITLGIPAAAATAGWLLAGREPPTLARAATE
jgi:putative ABC transport system permease protein